MSARALTAWVRRSELTPPHLVVRTWTPAAKPFYCSAGEHKVAHGSEARDKMGRAICPVHRRPLRIKGRVYGSGRRPKKDVRRRVQ